MKKRFLKIAAIVLAINFLTTALAPTLSYALTAGPTAPEYTSFEPVDTTDMVSLATGDFTYNIPLLEVPGPEGGYPLALSYHAGISPDEEASWVGLGWSLNAGAINRSIQGFPDDVFNSVRASHDYWPGGETNIFTVGAGYAMFSADVDIAHDTYKGTSVGISASAGYQYRAGNASLGVSATASSGLYGQGGSLGIQAFAGVRLSNDENAGILGVSAGISTNFHSISSGGDVGVRVGNVSIIGASINSNSLKPSLSLGGVSTTFIQNNNAGKISSTSDGMRATIPLPYGFTLTLGQQHQRYWSDERADLNMYGSLYSINSSANQATSSIDSYILPEFEDNNSSADQQKGGSFPAYDMYSVLGQGIGGTIQPYTFQNTFLYRQQITSNNANVVQFGRTATNNTDVQINFRFKNDFSNKFLMTSGGFPNSPVSYTNGIASLSLPNATREYDNNYYNDSRNQLAGSRHIDWFTNYEIQSGAFRSKSNFIPYEGAALGERALLVHGRDISKQIGGFVVTNASGVSYHYSLPVYAYSEYTKAVASDGSYKESFNNQPYAYTWLLTAITGPDYVDRGTFGISDEDLGYWVRFDYGKWTDNFQYRTPFTGTKKDLDQGFSIYTSGKKELYYLNYIRTRTHTALFEKDIRNDGKGVISSETGGITPSGPKQFNYAVDAGTNAALNFTISPLKLKSIYLFENSVLSSVLNSNQGTTLANWTGKGEGKFTNGYYYGEWHQDTNTPAGECTMIGSTYRCYGFSYGSTPVDHSWNNVLDVYDLATISDLTKSALRKINFNTSYDLCQNTPNSVADNQGYYEYYKAQGFGQGPIGSSSPWPNGANTNPYSLSNGGKLTLNSVEFRGKGGVAVMPSTIFHYNNSNVNGQYADLVTDETNNPSYNKDKKDIWENYKSDIDLDLLQKNETFARSVSETSSAAVHVWSLKEIETPVGAKIKIEYESDTYNEIVLGGLNSIPITGIEILDEWRVKVFVDNNNNSLTPIFNPYVQTGKTLKLIGSYKFLSEDQDDREHNNHLWCQTDEAQGIPKMLIWKHFNNDFIIANPAHIGSNYIIVTLPSSNKIDNYDIYNNRIPNSPTSHELGKVTNIVFNGTTGFDEYCPCTNHDGNPTSVIYNFKTDGQLAAGNVFFDTQITQKGGGLRVKKISVNTTDQIYSTLYEYSNGVTASLPGGYDNNFVYTTDINVHDKVLWKYQADANIQYRNNIAKLFKNVLAFSRELPGPGVMYENVKISESIQDANGLALPRTKPGYKEYKFRTFNFDENTKDVEKIQNLSGTRNNEVAYIDYTSRVGNLISTTDYNASNNKIEETIYQYLHDDISPAAIPGTLINNSAYNNLLDANYKKQGHIEELFHEFRLLGANNDELFIYTKRIEYPSILKKTITKNYKTGISSTSENIEFDFVTGIPVKTLSIDAMGNRFMNETTLAYTLDAYQNGMGIKIFNSYNDGIRVGKNMLSQSAGEKIYKVNNNNAPIGLIAAQVNTWKADSYQNTFYGQSVSTGLQTTQLWRPFRTYSWTGTEQLQADGTHDWTTFSNDIFNAWAYNQSPSPSSFWQKDQEITLYTDYSKVLEISDVNASYASSRMTPAQDMITATSSNSRYNQMGYSGAEYYTTAILTEGGISKGQGNVSIDFAHTGKASLAVSAGQKGFNVELPYNLLEAGRKYRASTWVYLPGFSENEKQEVKLIAKVGATEVSSVAVESKKAGSWYLLNLNVAPNGINNVIIECRNGNSSRTVYFDDFRFHPLDAPMISYVYNKETRELEAILNGDNLYTRYEYDATGKLSRIYSEMFGIAERKVSSTKYNYQRKN